ncbi:MAG: GGDEF domain-containing protein [Lachnospiraceae bacterium]
MDTKVIITEEIEREFEEIVQQKLIFSVYQPIVSLEDGEILGYEALSRIRKEDSLLNIGELFQAAEQLGKVWELEALCRRRSLKNAVTKPEETKLFLNVDPNCIKDEKFKSGITAKYLKQYNLKPSDIIFEITERSAITDAEMFKDTIRHYRREQFEIAIDDFGEGYSGVNRICATMPEYIKLDMELVRNINMDSVKQTMVENMVRLCKGLGIALIAEGIETQEEISELVRLQVQYGQGYYLQRPQKEMVGIGQEKKQEIKKLRKKNQSYYEPSFFGVVETICKSRETTTQDTRIAVLFDFVQHNPSITEISVLDEAQHVVGFLTRELLLEKLGGRFGFDLNSKKLAKDLMSKNFLAVDCRTSIEIVSKMALVRPQEHLYDAVVVTRDEKYLGVVTVKDLLETAISIQVTRAVDASPLTGLPGNKTIEKRIRCCLEADIPFTVIYLDLDNFKAYNDAYGFNNGDAMIQTVVSCMEECCVKGEFLGHIGGDDFVIVTEYWESEVLCENIMTCFSGSIEHLYSEEDWNRGFIISKNRNGFREEFPIATLSIAGLSNKEKKIREVEQFSMEIANLKKKCKQVAGNYYCVI